MLSKSDVLDAIDLKVDYIGAAASVEEHGITLIPVNKYMLCAEELMDLPQSEWWPFTHCAFEIQKCMNYVSREEAGMTSCDEADSGSDDTMALAGTERDLSTCTCTLLRRRASAGEEEARDDAVGTSARMPRFFAMAAVTPL